VVSSRPIMQSSTCMQHMLCTLAQQGLRMYVHKGDATSNVCKLFHCSSANPPSAGQQLQQLRQRQ
jgi:hypothetical protein